MLVLMVLSLQHVFCQNNLTTPLFCKYVDNGLNDRDLSSYSPIKSTFHHGVLLKVMINSNVMVSNRGDSDYDNAIIKVA